MNEYATNMNVNKQKEEDMKKNPAVESVISGVPEKIKTPYFIKNMPAGQNDKNEKAVAAADISEIPAPATADTSEASSAPPECYDPQTASIREKIRALNSEYFKLTKRQFEIMRENMHLQTEIFKIDWKYSSDFDEFVSGLIGKKSAPLERKHSANEKEYEQIEARLAEISIKIDELQLKIKK